MRIYTELIIENAANYKQIIDVATSQWRILNEDQSAELPSDTEIKVRNGNDVNSLPRFTGYVTIRSKVDTNE